MARQAPLSMAFPRQEYWSGLPFASPGDLPGSGIESASLASTGRFFTTEPPGKPLSAQYRSSIILIVAMISPQSLLTSGLFFSS